MEKVVSTVRRLSTALFGVVIFVSFLLRLASPVVAVTAEYQLCPVNLGCTIGEFLYNDDSTPLTGADCTYTARKPDGTIFINSASMAGASDGWYSYEVNTTSAVEGLYRGTVCCTPPGESIACIERSFEVGQPPINAEDVENAVWDATRADHNNAGTFGENLQNSTSISAADIWSYPSRSLTSFGSLVNDIWGNSSRKLTGFGDLVSSIWGNSSRSLTTNELGNNEYLMKTDSPLSVTSSSTTTNQTTITYDTLTQQLAETRALLEKIANEPIVETFIEDAPSEDLQNKLQYTEQILLSLREHVTRASNSIDLILLTWNSAEPAKISDGLNSTIQLLGKDVTTPRPETMLDQTQRLTQIWTSYQITSAVDQTKAALVSAINTQKELAIDGKSNATRRELEETAKFISMLSTVIGSEEDSYTKATAFGFLRDMQRRSQALSQQRISVESLLSDWHTSNQEERDQLLATVSREVHVINAVPSAQLITTPVKDAETAELRQKNTTYGLRALITANERLLAAAPNSLVNLVWFEEGSVVFRFLATNPSTAISQTVKINYQLPYEIGRDHILSHDNGLSIKYDPSTSAYVLTGEISLNPGESRTFAIETTDVWKIPQAEIDSLRADANTLYDNLQHTQFNAQANEIKTRIDETIIKIDDNQRDANTPDVRIRAYRENQLSLVQIRQDLANLTMLATSSATTRTPFGFVGGIQVIIMWSMVIILMAGFIYLALYTNAVRFRRKQHAKSSGTSSSKRSHRHDLPIWKRIALVLILSTIATTTTSAVGSALLAKQGLDKARALALNQPSTVLGTSIEAPRTSLLSGSDEPVLVHTSPTDDAQIYHKIPEDIYVIIKAKSKKWVQIQYTWGGLVYIGWVQDTHLQQLSE